MRFGERLRQHAQGQRVGHDLGHGDAGSVGRRQARALAGAEQVDRHALDRLAGRAEHGDAQSGGGDGKRLRRGLAAHDVDDGRARQAHPLARRRLLVGMHAVLARDQVRPEAPLGVGLRVRLFAGAHQVDGAARERLAIEEHKAFERAGQHEGEIEVLRRRYVVGELQRGTAEGAGRSAVVVADPSGDFDLPLAGRQARGVEGPVVGDAQRGEFVRAHLVARETPPLLRGQRQPRPPCHGEGIAGHSVGEATQFGDGLGRHDLADEPSAAAHPQHDLAAGVEADARLALRHVPGPRCVQR